MNLALQLLEPQVFAQKGVWTALRSRLTGISLRVFHHNWDDARAQSYQEWVWRVILGLLESSGE
jgi:hypothetical protein